MRSVPPRLACNAEEFTIAEEQLNYCPVVASLVQFSNDTHVTRLLRWTFTPAERQAIADGDDLFFGTFAEHALMPHWFTVGDPTKLVPKL